MGPAYHEIEAASLYAAVMKVKGFSLHLRCSSVCVLHRNGTPMVQVPNNHILT